VATPELKHEIKELIITTLQIPGVAPEQIDDSAALFGTDLLGLDSVDALELVVALQEKFAVSIKDKQLAGRVLQSVNTIADFVESCQGNVQ
jgi:acyl carrier protein